MKWYVNRNGQILGPVDSHQIDQWIAGGMRDVWVMNDVDGKWVTLDSSPFGRSRRNNMIFGGVIALAGLVVAGSIVVNSGANERQNEKNSLHVQSNRNDTSNTSVSGKTKALNDINKLIDDSNKNPDVNNKIESFNKVKQIVEREGLCVQAHWCAFSSTRGSQVSEETCKFCEAFDYANMATEGLKFSRDKQLLKTNRPKSKESIMKLLGAPANTMENAASQTTIYMWFYETKKQGRDVISCTTDSSNKIMLLDY